MRQNTVSLTRPSLGQDTYIPQSHSSPIPDISGLVLQASLQVKTHGFLFSFQLSVLLHPVQIQQSAFYILDSQTWKFPEPCLILPEFVYTQHSSPRNWL